MIENHLAAVYMSPMQVRFPLGYAFAGGRARCMLKVNADQTCAASGSRRLKGGAVGIARRRNSTRLVFVLAPVVVVLLVSALVLVSCASGTTSTTAPPTTASSTTTQGVTTTAAQTPGGQTAFGGYPEGAACADCHNDSTVLASKQSQMKQRSVHGTGEAFEEGR